MSTETQLTPEGFDDLFIHYTKECRTYVEAYFKAERDHIKKHGRTKYSSYDSYRTARAKRLGGVKI